ncbi:MAG: hypothetical protein Q9227_006018 [Pyrenula ochraceoflavens]
MHSFVQGLHGKIRRDPFFSIQYRNRSTPQNEPKKVIVSKSSRIAVRQSLVHILPVLTSVTILAVNIHGIYIGVDFSGPLHSDTIDLMFLQLAAKANELLIVASLSLMILHTLRYELLYGDGLPLGLIGSGLSFSSFGLFFRKEFYSSLKYLSYNRKNRTRKIGFLALLIIAGLTAVLSGPASAVLLVPKSQTYPLGGTDVYLNGSASHFWPNDVADDIDNLSSYCNSKNAIEWAICPGGGFFSLWEQWDTMSSFQFNTAQQNAPPYAKDISGSRFYSSVRSPSSQIPPRYALGDPRSNDGTTSYPYTWLVQTHAAASVILQRVATDWWAKVPLHMGVSERRIDDRNIKASVPSVISNVRCSDPQNMSATEKEVQFPTIEGRWDFAQSLGFIPDNLNANSSKNLRFHWVHLPENFGSTSIGGVFESPWDLESGSRVVVGCTAQTGWIPTDHFTDSYTFWTGWYPWNLQFGGRTPAWLAESNAPTNGRIALSDRWLELLTPVARMKFQDPAWQASTIESVLDNVGLADTTRSSNETTLTDDWTDADSSTQGGRIRVLETIICSFLADGLSRAGSYRVFNTTGLLSNWSLAMYDPLPDFHNKILKGRPALRKPDLPSEDFVTLHTRMMITGLAFRATLAGYLATVVLLMHAVLAIGFSCWITFHKRISHSWDSISELIALSHNSQPTVGCLKNTGAGIECGKTFARVARIRVVHSPSVERDSDEHVELVFEDFADGQVEPRIQAVIPRGRSVSGRSISPGRPSSRVSALSGSWTFPLGPDRSDVQADVELEGGSSGTERLIPEVHLPDERGGGLVRVNHRYG